MDWMGLYMSPEEEAKAKGMALAQALARQKGIGNVGLLSGDKVLSQFGAAQLQDAQKQGGQLSEAGQTRYQGGLQQALAKLRESGDDRRMRWQLQAQRDIAGAKAKSDAAEATKRGQEQLFDVEKKLRDEYEGDPATRAMQTVRDSYAGIRGAPETGAGDIGLLYNFLHVVEPGSMVKDTEFSTTGQSGGLPGQVQGYFNKLSGSGMLPPAVRKQLKEEAARLYKGKREAHEKFREARRGLSKQYGADPGRVVLDLGFDVDGPDLDLSGATPQFSGGQPMASSPKHRAALEWAQANRNDPRAAEILKLHGAQ